MRPSALFPLVLLVACEGGKPSATDHTGPVTGQPTISGTGTGATAGTGTGTGTGSATGSTAPVGDCTTLGGPGAVHAGSTYTVVQDAIDASSPGGTVWLCPGTYTDVALTIPHSLWLEGVGGAAEVELRGDLFQSVIAAAAGHLTVVGLTIRSGGGTFGGGISAADVESLTVTDSVIEDNVGTYGAGIHAGGTITLTGTQVRNNAATSYGGGVAVDDDGELWLELSTISLNSSEDLGGGVFGFEGASVWSLDGSQIRENSAEHGAGLYLWNGAASGVRLRDNTANSTGGGLVVFGGGTLEDLEIEGNTAALGAGVNADDGPISATDVLVRGNHATSQGGGLHLDTVDLSTTNLEVDGNGCDGLGGGAFVRDITWTGGTISGNSAADGGGIYVSSTSAGATLDGQVIERNAATESGGGVNTQSGLVGTNLEIRDNTSETRAGGFYASSSAVFALTDSTIELNEALSAVNSTYGGGLYVNGGAAGTLTDTAVSMNLCERGGGIYINAASSLTLVGGEVTMNGDGTTVSGGGVRIQEGDLDASGVDFGTGPTDNTPDDVYCVGGPASLDVYGAASTFTCDEVGCLP